MSTTDELRRVFNKFDVNGDGKISSSELGAMIRSMGQKATDSEIETMMAEADKDGDGFISLDEFTQLNLKRRNDAEAEQELRDAFAIFDKDGNGLISAEELFKVLRSLGDHYSVDACRKMISGVDANGDGFVDFDEFKVMMARNGAGTSSPASKTG